MTETSCRSALPKSVLVFAPSSIGGIGEHAHYQSLELARRGVAATVLCRADAIRTAPAGT